MTMNNNTNNTNTNTNTFLIQQECPERVSMHWQREEEENAQVEDFAQMLVHLRLVMDSMDIDSLDVEEEAVPVTPHNPIQIKVKQGIECPVCYQDIPFEHCVRIQCGHSFCYKCILQVMKQTSCRCPMCRANIEQIETNSSTIANLLIN